MCVEESQPAFECEPKSLNRPRTVQTASRKLIVVFRSGDVDLASDSQEQDRNEHPSFWINRCDGPYSSQWPPMTAFIMHQTGIHLEERSALIGMDCPCCGEVILTRAAMYEPHGDVHDAIGFRIPGLQYERSLPDGLGVLVEGGRIVGRFLHCCPCCEGASLEEIEMEVPNVPMRTPNPTLYGEVKSYPYNDGYA
jgi:hypothetical protein